jgi:hypothetical protein
MTAALLQSLRDLIQEDVGGRGLRTEPTHNLITACPDDFADACRSIAETPQAKLLVVTGFHIVHGNPPCCETDGPLGALFLARALTPLGIQVLIASDGTGVSAVNAGLEICHLQDEVRVIQLPREAWDDASYQEWVLGACDRSTPLTHLVALERVGPSHTLRSLQAQPALAQLPAEYRHVDPEDGVDVRVVPRVPDVSSKSRELPAQKWLLLCHVVEMFEKEVPPPDRNRCHSMRGVDITKETSPAHLLFENASRLEPAVKTIGIGDGGNEIGMGKIAWDVIRRNIKQGGRIACRLATDYLIVAGVSNWGAYGLATGVRLLCGAPHAPDLYDVDRERQLLQVMIDFGPLVDGVTGTRTALVDGLPFERYGEVLKKMGELVQGTSP